MSPIEEFRSQIEESRNGKCRGRRRRVRVYAYGGPTDLRKGYDGLSALVTHTLGPDPLSGELHLFVSRNRKRAEVLLWDGGSRPMDRWWLSASTL